jgi:hypothetical protein
LALARRALALGSSAANAMNDSGAPRRSGNPAGFASRHKRARSTTSVRRRTVTVEAKRTPGSRQSPSASLASSGTRAWACTQDSAIAKRVAQGRADFAKPLDANQRSRLAGGHPQALARQGREQHAQPRSSASRLLV